MQAFRNDSKELNDKVTIPFFLTIPFFPKGTERNEERGEIQVLTFSSFYIYKYIYISNFAPSIRIIEHWTALHIFPSHVEGERIASKSTRGKRRLHRILSLFFLSFSPLLISLHSIVHPSNQSGCEIRQTHR